MPLLRCARCVHAPGKPRPPASSSTGRKTKRFRVDEPAALRSSRTFPSPQRHSLPTPRSSRPGEDPASSVSGSASRGHLVQVEPHAEWPLTGSLHPARLSRFREPCALHASTRPPWARTPRGQRRRGDRASVRRTDVQGGGRPSSAESLRGTFPGVVPPSFVPRQTRIRTVSLMTHVTCGDLRGVQRGWPAKEVTGASSARPPDAEPGEVAATRSDGATRPPSTAQKRGAAWRGLVAGADTAQRGAGVRGAGRLPRRCPVVWSSWSGQGVFGKQRLDGEAPPPRRPRLGGALGGVSHSGPLPFPP